MVNETEQYEEEVKKYFEEHFKNLGKEIKVERQWRPFKGESISKYSPIVDVAVGPFAYGDEKYIREYNELTEMSCKLLNNLSSSFRENSKGFSFMEKIPADCYEFNNINRNARCFMAIEIEKSGTRKHMLGDIVNACSLGRIGIIIAWNPSVLKSFLRITEYFSFLRSKDKPTYESRNLIIVLKEQFLKSFHFIESDKHEL
ncbi:MAG: hypothetical protein QW566_02165 [Candidatus Jordarchaeales archaeon]